MTLKYTDKIPPRICLNCGLKVCTRCQIPKHPSEFYCHSRANDHLQSECKECHKQRQLKQQTPNQTNKPVAPNYLTRFCPACQHKTCGHCLTAKPINEFCKLAKSKDGHDNWCKPCAHAYRQRQPRSKETAQRYAEANVERQREIQKAYRERHKEREVARKKAYVLRKRAEKLAALQNDKPEQEDS